MESSPGRAINGLRELIPGPAHSTVTKKKLTGKRTTVRLIRLQGSAPLLKKDADPWSRLGLTLVFTPVSFF